MQFDNAKRYTFEKYIVPAQFCPTRSQVATLTASARKEKETYLGEA